MIDDKRAYNNYLFNALYLRHTHLSCSYPIQFPFPRQGGIPFGLDTGTRIVRFIIRSTVRIRNRDLLRFWYFLLGTLGYIKNVIKNVDCTYLSQIKMIFTHKDLFSSVSLFILFPSKTGNSSRII